MGASFGKPWAKGEHRGGAIERLDLGLLVDAQDEGPIGGIDVEAHDVAHLVDEERVGAELKSVDQVGFEAEGPPDPADRALAHSRRPGHRPRRPVGGVDRRLLESLDDHRLDVVVGDGARGARARLVVETLEAIGQEPTAPLAHRVRIDAQSFTNLVHVSPIGAGQDNPTPQRQRLGTLRSSGPALERLALVVAQHHWFEYGPSHCCLQSSLTKGTTRRDRRNSSGRDLFLTQVTSRNPPPALPRRPPTSAAPVPPPPGPTSSPSGPNLARAHPMRPIPVAFHIGPLEVHTYGIGLAPPRLVRVRLFRAAPAQERLPHRMARAGLPVDHPGRRRRGTGHAPACRT